MDYLNLSKPISTPHIVYLRKSLLAALLVLITVLPSVFHALNHQTTEMMLFQTILEDNVLLIPKAYADPLTPGIGGEKGIAQEFFSTVLNVFVILNWFALSAVQALLDYDVIFGEKNAAGVRPMELILRNIWVTSRDIVNGIFAFILLAAAIYLVIKSDSDAMGKIKSGAKNFVLAVVLVNFSWFFPRVILDMANVLTSVVYQIPSLVNHELPCIGEINPGPDKILGTSDDTNIPCRYVWRVHLFPTMGKCDPDLLAFTGTPPECNRPVDESGGASLGDPDYGKQYWDFVDVFYTKWDFVAKSGWYWDEITGRQVPISGADVVLNGLAVNFAKLPNFNLIDFEDMRASVSAAIGIEKVLGAYLKFFIELIMHVIFSIAVGLALIALAVVLVVRIAAIWIMIAFMPCVFIGFALRGPGGMGELGVGETKAPNIWKTFLSYAFLPAIVAVPFAIGFALMSQLYYIKTLAIPLRIDGLSNILPKGIDTFHELLWTCIAIAIIWFGVFTILAKDKIAGGIVQGIRGIGTTGAKIAGYGAMSVPIIPMGGGKMMSPIQAYDRFKRMPDVMRFRPIAEKAGGGTAPPPPKEKIEKVVRENREVVERGVGGIRSAATNAELSAAIRQLSNELVRTGSLSQGEADAMMASREGVRNLLEAAGVRDREAIMTKIEPNFAGAGAAAPSVRVHLNVDGYRTMSGEEIRKDISQQYFHSGLDSRTVKRDLEQNINRATDAAVQEAIRRVANEITEDMNIEELKNKLREINPDLPAS